MPPPPASASPSGAKPQTRWGSGSPAFLPEPCSQGSFSGTPISPQRPRGLGGPESLLASPRPPPPLPS